MKPTQTPTARESITVTLTHEELQRIINLLAIAGDFSALQLRSRLQFLLPNIGDACRHSAHIPEAPGQDGILDSGVVSGMNRTTCGSIGQP